MTAILAHQLVRRRVFPRHGAIRTFRKLHRFRSAHPVISTETTYHNAVDREVRLCRRHPVKSSAESCCVENTTVRLCRRHPLSSCPARRCHR